MRFDALMLPPLERLFHRHLRLLQFEARASTDA
jgi:hypothetical protein